MTIEERMLEWESSVPREMTADALWASAAYRFATFLSDDIENETALLSGNPLTAELAGQLRRAIGSIGATYAEGHAVKRSRSLPVL